MNLVFEETANRNRCGCEVLVNGLTLQCTFSTSKTVTIPAGLHYFDGKLELNESNPAATLSVCTNHERRLKNAFEELFNKA